MLAKTSASSTKKFQAQNAMKLRLGLIGLSQDWGKRHAPALRLLRERFEVAGIYNAVSTLADKAVREFESVRFDSYRDLLASDVDAVLFLESGWYGTAPILAACDYGKAIYFGRQVDVTLEEVSALRPLVDKSGVAFMAEFPRRYAPASLRLKELIVTRLGKPKLLFCHRRLEDTAVKRGERSVAAQHDRELIELIDWCSYIVGNRVRSVQGVRQSTDERLGYESLSLDLSGEDEQDGTTIAQISCGSYIKTAWSEAITVRSPASLQVCCERGMAYIDLPNSLVWYDEAGGHRESLDAELAVGQQLLAQFHRATTSLIRKMGDLEDLNESLCVLSSVREIDSLRISRDST